MINKIIFYVSLAFVALMLVQTFFQRVYGPSALPDMPIETAPKKDGREEKMMAYLQQGAEAQHTGNLGKAEEHFREGFKIARELGDKRMVQGFIVLVVNMYIEQKAFDRAEAFLEVTRDKGDIDTITYHTQRVALFENQQKTEDMCTELKTLEGLLSGLACETVDADIKIFLEGKDKARMIEMMQGKNSAVITDCIGKYAVRDKLKLCK